MLGRYFLIFCGIVALAWTAYISFDIIDKKDKLSPYTTFGVEDQELLIIHRTNEFEWHNSTFVMNHENKVLIDQIKVYPHHLQSIYISKNRAHILFESTEKWSISKIKKLLSSTNENPKFDGVSSFKTKNFQGEFYKNRLYLYNNIQNTTPLTKNWVKFDKKSIATVIIFEKENFTYTDLYYKGDNKIMYITKSSDSLVGKQVDDKNLFMNILPITVKSYHFYEKEYLSFLDENFSKSPMYDWLDKGLVEIEVNGEKVVISDFIGSQDPLNTLYDFIQKNPENQPYGYFQNIQLYKGFPSSVKEGFYAYNADNYVVMSENQQICEEIVANYRLGNTLSQHADNIAEIYDHLPSKVSERFVGKESKFSKSIYGKQLFHTEITNLSKLADNNKEVEKTYQTYSMGGEIHDFYLMKGEGNFAAITKSGFFRIYQNGIKTWEKQLNGQVVGEIDKIVWKEMPHWMITTKNGIHVIDENGNYALGFPSVVADKQLTVAASAYSWKGRSWVLAVNNNSEVLVINQGGQRETKIKTNLKTVENPIMIWLSNRKVYFGLYDANTFKMYDVQSKNEYRSFAIPAQSKCVKMQNEIYLFGLEGGQLLKIDQKGNKSTIMSGLENFNIIQSDVYENNAWVLLNNEGLVKAINVTSNQQFAITSLAKNSKYASLDYQLSNKTIITIVDDIENNVYLYQLNGQIVKQTIEGSQKAITSTDRLGNLLLTTIVDNFIVQHTIK
ncbi:MAG: hypothetical protein E6Q89_03160 [Bacteroidia bacterium]|nr:MAG: hypothetical protein E6Q89_03160 [Bacteroidia bacterium]